MNSVAEPPKSADRPAARTTLRSPRLKSAELTTNRYENVSSMLVALLITLGAAVGVLVVVWLTSRIFVRQTAAPVEMIELVDPSTNGGPVGPTEKLETPVLSSNATDVEQMLSIIDEAAAENLADPSALGADASPGAGDHRKPGAGTKAKEPKWEIAFLEGNTLDLYAQQLDYFRVELGAIGADSPDVIYASGLSKSPIQTRTAPQAEEKRMYMSWRPGSPLRDADLKLMAKAGIEDPRRLVVQFYPDDVVGRLQQLEKDFRGVARSAIQRTRFGVRMTTSGGYEFYVIDQLVAVQTNHGEGVVPQTR